MTNKTPIRVGMVFDLSPNSGFNSTENNVLDGYDVQVALEIGKILCRPIEFVDAGSFDVLQNMILQCEIDMVLSQMDRTDAREVRFFQIPYVRNKSDGKLPFIFQQEVYDNLNPPFDPSSNCLEALNSQGEDTTIRVLTNTTYFDYFTSAEVVEKYENIKIFPLSSFDNLFTGLNSGSVTTVVTDPFPLADDLILDYGIADPEFDVGPISIGINRQKCDFAKQVIDAVNILISDDPATGKLKELEDKYLAGKGIVTETLEDLPFVIPDYSIVNKICLTVPSVDLSFQCRPCYCQLRYCRCARSGCQ